MRGRDRAGPDRARGELRAERAGPKSRTAAGARAPATAPRRARSTAPASTPRSSCRIAGEHGIDLDEVEGTRRRRPGPQDGPARADRAGPIQRRRSRSAAAHRVPLQAGAGHRAGPASADELIGPTRREPLTPMRQAIGGTCSPAGAPSAHCTTIVEADFSAAAARRAELEGRRDRPTYLAFVARASSRRSSGTRC